ncbi:MAG: pyridoxamine 5'-phosphate oxidase family protein [Phenylobacterium sp.]|uniref:pyridoxamine 5'-phosphate oxidase family protein n=1 Tax=Phenylobacterium sp. TaxID=1871053 RepID=UPI001A643973|nr:pyridoxamine 5'-phosphate oxidase family protein [Phenylobacterium sp.]MBL8770416.1 pyridoxamine 5'-phosphate oxidase family protein [Phenylobacterium sp.]
MTLSNAEIADRLWKAIDDNHTGMLGLQAERQHFQPMTAFVERDTSTLWFFTRDDTDLAQTVGAGAEATFLFMDRKLQACIDGRLSLAHDRDRIDRYWNAHVAAWYPDGKDDPSLTLLRLDVEEAAVWITEGGLLKYAVEVAKANVTRSTPDVGERRDLHLR